LHRCPTTPRNVAAKSQTRHAGLQNETDVSICGARCGPLHKSDINTQF